MVASVPPTQNKKYEAPNKRRVVLFRVGQAQVPPQGLPTLPLGLPEHTLVAQPTLA